ENVRVIVLEFEDDIDESITLDEIQEEQTDDGIHITDLQTVDLSPIEFINRARNELEAGRTAQALSSLESLRQLYFYEDDEVLWLYGQLFEANSPIRDVRRALDYYNRLISEYPQSIYLSQARQRIVFLERFFFNIR
ncbi:MAG: tetratricopeptide repeat protein, partial [Treponema sp.]|nr:tetratricopeptide repeat protein [Treponema sp.]